jgi:outer membrane cobalamin receptor
MIKFITGFFILICCASSIYAQKLATFRGRVVDSSSHQPVGFATIALKKVVGAELKTLSQADGTFKFENITSGQYQVAIAVIGYRSVKVNLTFLANQLNEKPVDFFISSSGYQLNTVTINALKPLIRQESDRLIYDISADPDSKSDNMLQMMQKIPFLSIDGNDNLLLKGSGDFKVLIDGRSTGVTARNPKDALRMMSAFTVKEVEVITSPSAKYDSEGTAGIINIITKKNLVGATLYTLLHANTRQGRGFESAITLKKGQTGLYVWSGYWHYDMLKNRFNNLRTAVSPNAFSIRQEGWSKTKGYDFPITAEFGYEIDSLNLLNASLSTVKDVQENFGNQIFNGINNLGYSNYAYNVDNQNTTATNSITIALNYQLGFRKNKKTLLTASYKLNHSKNSFNNETINDGIFNYPDRILRQENNYGTNEHTLQFDFSSPLKRVNTESGAKLILRNYFSVDDFNNSIASTSSTNELEYQQNIIGLYNSYQFNAKKWGFKAGLRLERTVINANFIANNTLLNRNFNNLIPSISINYRINPTKSMSIAYTQRIQRPAIWQLNPFLNQSNPFYYTFGNPDLSPGLFHSTEIGFNRYKKTSYNFNLNYSFARNTIQPVAFVGLDSITRASFQNLGKTDNLSFNSSINYPISKTINFSFNLRLQYLAMQGRLNTELLKNDGFTAAANLGLVFRLPNNLRISPSLMINSPQPTLQGRSNGNVFTVIGIQQQLLKRKMNISFHLYNMNQKSWNIKNSIRGEGFLQENTTAKIQRGFYLGVNYTFGQLKEQVKKTKNLKNDDLSTQPTEN